MKQESILSVKVSKLTSQERTRYTSSFCGKSLIHNSTSNAIIIVKLYILNLGAPTTRKV